MIDDYKKLKSEIPILFVIKIFQKSLCVCVYRLFNELIYLNSNLPTLIKF